MWLFRNIVFYLVNFLVFQLSFINYLSDESLRYSPQIFFWSAIVLFVLLVIKWRNKWTGIITLNLRTKKYGIFYTARLSKKFLGWTYLFYGIEAVISLVFPLVYLYFDQQTWIFSALLLLNGIESAAYLFINTRKGNFKIGINKNAVVHNARGTMVLPFHELKSVVYRYDEFFFIYQSGETLTIPEYIVEEADTPALREHIAKMAGERGIFVTEKMREK